MRGSGWLVVLVLVAVPVAEATPPAMPPPRLFHATLTAQGDPIVGQQVDFVAELYAEGAYSGEILLFAPGWVTVEPAAHNVSMEPGDAATLRWTAVPGRAGGWAAALMAPDVSHAFRGSMDHLEIFSGPTATLSAPDVHALETSGLRYNFSATLVDDTVVVRYRERSTLAWATALPQALSLSRAELTDWGWQGDEPQGRWEGIAHAPPSGSLTLPLADGETVHVLAASTWTMTIDHGDYDHEVWLSPCGSPFEVSRTGGNVTVQRVACQAGETPSMFVAVPWNAVFDEDGVVEPDPAPTRPTGCAPTCPAPSNPTDADTTPTGRSAPAADGLWPGAILMLACLVRRRHGR